LVQVTDMQPIIRATLDGLMEGVGAAK